MQKISQKRQEIMFLNRDQDNRGGAVAAVILPFLISRAGVLIS